MPQCRRVTYTTAGPCPPSPRPRPSWTNTLTTSWKSHYKVGFEEDGKLGLVLDMTWLPRDVTKSNFKAFMNLLSLGFYRPCLPEFPTIPGCLCVCGSISYLPSDFPELDGRPASPNRLHLGPPHPVHWTHAAVRDTPTNKHAHTHSSREKQKKLHWQTCLSGCGWCFCLPWFWITRELFL